MNRQVLIVLKAVFDATANQIEQAVSGCKHGAILDVKHCIRQAQAHMREYLIETEGDAYPVTALPVCEVAGAERSEIMRNMTAAEHYSCNVASWKFLGRNSEQRILFTRKEFEDALRSAFMTGQHIAGNELLPCGCVGDCSGHNDQGPR